MNNSDFKKVIDNFQTIKDKDNKHLQMDSIIISDLTEGRRYKHLFNEDDCLHPVRSICKSVVSMCYGIMLDDNNELNLDSLIWPIIKDKVHLSNNENIDKLSKIKLIHLFTHTIGFNVKLLKSKDVADIDPSTYLDLVCNTPIEFMPGEHFLYSNAAPFLLSVVFQEVTGENLSVFAKKNIFNKIGISDYKWKNYGNYCAGATGLELTSDDLHKLALLLASNGNWQGVQVVPQLWMSEMKKTKIFTPSMYNAERVFPKYAYGLLIWICGNEADSNYFIDGSDGQYILIVPKKDLIITILGHQKDMKPITECVRFLL